MSSYNHDLSIWITEVSATGFRVNGRIKLGQNSYNANGFHVETGVSGYGSRGHTAKIGSRGGSFDFSDYYSVGTSYDARSFSCHVSADLSWSSSGTNTGNPVYTTAKTPAAEFNKPYPPKNPAVSRVSDTQAKVTWEGNWDNASGRYWHKVYVERSTDGGGYSQIAALNWDVTNYFDNGVSANHAYTYRLRAANTKYSDYVTAGTVYNTPAAPKSVTASLVSAGTVRVDADASNVNTATSYAIERSVNGGEWTAVTEVASFPYDDTGAAGMVSYRVRSLRGSLASTWAVSEQIAAITPPLAPTIGELSSAYPIPSTVTVSWVRNHSDGSEQTAAQVEVTAPDGTASVIEAGARGYVEVECSEEGEYRVRVRTKGIHADWGAWSSQSAFRAATAPVAHFTNPAADGDLVEAVPFTASWEVTSASGVSMQEFVVLDASGEAVYRQKLDGSARSFALSMDTFMPKNGSGYTFELDVTNGYSLTATTRRTVTVDYAEPAAPHVTVDYDMSDLSVHVMVDKGAEAWKVEDERLVSPEYWDGSDDDVPVNAGFRKSSVDGAVGIGEVMETVRLSVSRLTPDGVSELLASDLETGTFIIDRLPPLNVDYKYIVTAYSAVGTATVVEVPAYVDSGGAEAYNFGTDASTAVLLELDADVSSSSTADGEWFEFALGPSTAALPTFYADGGLDVSGRQSYIVTTPGEYRAIDAIRRSPRNAVCWYRDYWGGRHRVKADWTLGYAASSYHVWNVGVSLTEAVWEVPSNG